MKFTLQEENTTLAFYCVSSSSLLCCGQKQPWRLAAAEPQTENLLSSWSSDLQGPALQPSQSEHTELARPAHSSPPEPGG